MIAHGVAHPQGRKISARCRSSRASERKRTQIHFQETPILRVVPCAGIDLSPKTPKKQVENAPAWLLQAFLSDEAYLMPLLPIFKRRERDRQLLQPR
jgi:hypothetical protein